MESTFATRGTPGPAGNQVRWRAAFAGLTPRAITIVAALTLARVLWSALQMNALEPSGNAPAAGLSWILSMWGFMLVMGAVMLVAVVVTANLGPQRGAPRVLALGLALAVSTAVGALLRWPMMTEDLREIDWSVVGAMLMYVWPRYVLLGGLLTAIAEFYRHEVNNVAATHQANVDRAAFEREMVEARFTLLQAQVEPHFLFNTLANVRRLYTQDASAGRAMLESLMRYLEMALPHMRSERTTLQQEVELVAAYLRVQRIRMGARLAFRVDVPAALREREVPPMMLLTLVENAVKHGLNPSTEGGRIQVSARSEDARIVLTVADDGVGFTPSSGTGTGLANISARLAAQYGSRAGLALENNDLGGATATIALPAEHTT